MQAIVPHLSTDFDALGAAVGANVLYPGAQIVLPGSLAPGVAAFLSLHRYQFRTVTARDIDLADIEQLILVDNMDPDRLGPLAEVSQRDGVKLHVYDHHPRDYSDVEAELEVWAEVGAASTLIAEVLHEAGRTLQPAQATVMMLGIYADTGSLTLPVTTPRDLQAAAWLLEQGASLPLLGQFLDQALSPAQHELFEQLHRSLETWSADGVSVKIARGYSAQYVHGLALVVHKLQTVVPAPAIVVAVQMENRVQLVARSTVAWVNAARVLKHFGGGGHPGAAAAAVKGVPVDEVVRRLHAALRSEAGEPVRARDLMKTPVRVVRPATTIDDAHRVMLRYGHSGLAVVSDGQVVGIISQRDTERARRHRLGHAPVSGAMQRPAITVSPNTTLDEMQTLMVSRDIGRLPVIAGERLLGIVTRSDVLGALYGQALPHWHHTTYVGEGFGQGFGAGTADVDAAAELAWRLAAADPAVRAVLTAAGQTARALAVPAYAVGGFVRDLLLDVPTGDLDLVVVGDGLAFAQTLGRRLDGRVNVVPRFGTAHIYLPGNTAIDVATARREFYEFAAALPVVRHGDIKDDLYRRDFTINAMAVRLTPEGSGSLVDYFGGFKDLQERRVRVLHSLSFVEDPTRILRAVRFCSRYGFEMDPETRDLAGAAVAGGFVERVSRERLAKELLLIFRENRAVAILADLARLGALALVLPGVTWNNRLAVGLERATRFIEGDGVPAALFSLKDRVEPELLYIAVLAAEAGDAAALIDRLRLSRHWRRALEVSLGVWHRALGAVRKPNITAAAIVEALAELPPVGLCLIWLYEQRGLGAERVEAYWHRLRHVRARITAAGLAAAGLPPGPAYAAALAAARRVRLNHPDVSEAEELAAALGAALKEG